MSTMSYIASSGMTPAHFAHFQRVAKEQNRIIVVRNTNQKSTQWIQLGYPAKPKGMDLHTADDTGKVTAKNEFEKAEAKRHPNGYYVINADGFAWNGRGQKLDVQFPLGMENKDGQVIDPLKKKALVGDYDLQGVIDPGSPGRILALVASNGRPVENVSNTDVERIRMLLNAGFDQPRVMHGPEDLFKSFRGACTAFLADGSASELPTQMAVEQFYAELGRATREGSYRH